MRTAYFNDIYEVGDTTVMTEEFAMTEGMRMPSQISENEDLPTVDLKKGYRVNFTTFEFADRLNFSYRTRLEAGDQKLITSELVQKELAGWIGWMKNYVEIEAHRCFNQAFTTAPVTANNGDTRSFVSPDLQPMISANHVYNTGQTFSNLLPTAPLTLATFALVEQLAWSFVDPVGIQMPLHPTKIYVKMGSTAATAAKQILWVRENNAQYRVAASGNINIYTWRYTIVESPWITSDTAYFFTSEYSMSGIENPLFFHFRERPALQLSDTSVRNLQMQYAFAASIKFGLRKMPVWIRGSPWA